MYMEVLTDYINAIVDLIINPLIGLLFAVSVVLFIWGLFRLIWNNGDTEEIKKGKQALTWGLVGIFIMFSVFGILEVVTNTFGV